MKLKKLFLRVVNHIMGHCRIYRDKDNILRDAITAIGVCHNVTPVIDDGVKTYNAASPDEIALSNENQYKFI
jgi:hypothetical protein